jgi:hypothetical protein
MKRPAEVVHKSLEFGGASAREVAAFLGLEKGGSLELELADFLGGSGDFPPAADTTHESKNRISWDHDAERLRLEGRWYDWESASPRRAGPRFSFDAPRDLDQKSLAIFKNWARVYQRVQAQGKPSGGRTSEIRRAVQFRMESDRLRRAGWLRRTVSRIVRKDEVIVVESLSERNGRGLWLEFRVGPWLRR